MTAQESGTVSAGRGEPLVVLDGVQKHFGQLHALKDIELTVKRGEVVVVIGPSGSGKSTLCRTINRLETIDEGTITLDGKDLPQEGKALAALRAEVGMVFQSFNLVAHKMGFARTAADRVVFMADGAIIEENTPEEFFTHPRSDRAKDFLGKILKH